MDREAKKAALFEALLAQEFILHVNDAPPPGNENLPPDVVHINVKAVADNGKPFWAYWPIRAALLDGPLELLKRLVFGFIEDQEASLLLRTT